MKKMNAIVSLFSFILITICSQSVYAKDEVPNEIKQVVINKFPSAENITWKEYSDTQYLAYFIHEEEEVDVYIDKKGEILECVTHLNDANVPQGIKDYVAGMNDANLYYVLETDFSNGVRVYIAKVKLAGQLYELGFDSNFKLISTK
jgi:hypothetical protein